MCYNLFKNSTTSSTIKNCEIVCAHSHELFHLQYLYKALTPRMYLYIRLASGQL